MAGEAFEGVVNVDFTAGATPLSLTALNQVLLDSFEDQDLAEYGGDTGDFDIDGTGPWDGSYHTHANTSTSHKIISDTGVTVGQGDRITFREYFASASNGGGIVVGTQSEVGSFSADGYKVGINNDSNGAGQLGIFVWSGGSENGLAQSSEFTNYTGLNYFNIIDWQGDGTLACETWHPDPGVGKLGSVSTTDTTYTSGGLGWDDYDTVYHDYAVRNPDLIEDWEDANAIGRWFGDTGNASISTGTVREGNQSLALQTPSGGGNSSIRSMGKATNFTIGNRFYAWIWVPSGGEIGLGWFRKGGDHYTLRARDQVPEYVLTAPDGTELDSVAADPTVEAWLRVDVEHLADGSISVSILRDSDSGTEATLSATDTQRTEGGQLINCYHPSSQVTGYADYWHTV